MGMGSQGAPASALVSTRRFVTIFDFSRFKADGLIKCGGCSHEQTVKAAALTQAFGPVPIHQAERRCKCSVCGHRGAQIVPIPA